MRTENIQQEDIYDSQFGYEQYFDSKRRLGWMLTFNLIKNDSDQFVGTIYFVDESSNNFKASLIYYPSLLIEVDSEIHGVEEYLRKRYEGNIYETKIVEKIDSKEFNHLNKPPKKFLKVYFRTNTIFQMCLKHLKEIINESSVNRHKNEVYSDFCQEKQIYEVTRKIIQIHEFDISHEIQFGMENEIRCGCWYYVSYNGKDYLIIPSKEKVAYPDLRIFAFDIETTKPPLKFPCSEYDEIMMISIMTDDFGELIVNRKIISQDITEFEYQAKDDMKCNFRIFNEENEEALLTRFLEVIIEFKPHVITTYNGGFFDWPFIDTRMKKYNLSLEQSIQFTPTVEYYECPYILHIDCYKWVKRDSYLPMNNQGLKDVTSIKLGYFPDEIDPEDMVRYATEDPLKLASYSVSDAVATYYIYMKYVQPHVFSVSSLIPLPPVQILCKGSGTLCETLLLAESLNYSILIPEKKRTEGLEYYNGHIVENFTYVGGHVESLRAGIFRSDFEQKFTVTREIVELITDNIDGVLEYYINEPEYKRKKAEYIQMLQDCIGDISCKGSIYHLDVGAMYPNIILTNRLQPYSVVNEDICIRCDFNDESNLCKKRLKWIARAEFVPPTSNEINMIKSQLENEIFSSWTGESAVNLPYRDLTKVKQEAILKERVIEYSRNIYKRIKKTEEREQDVTICQREVPFYVETVRKFRDQRYVYKELYKKALTAYEQSPTAETMKKMTVFNSLQTAYKCILNSFYGYVMREGSRWYSLEMAATVCNIGGEVIILAKNFIENIGIPLELDTDGIWSIIPEKFPCNLEIGGKSISVFNLALNYFVCKKFTNEQYQILNSEGKHVIKPQNSILFELDGPYKTMILPSSTEENKLLKKRYVVFDFSNKICELKGFELKRRGELNFIKKFQEDIFTHFNDGQNLQECYDSLAIVCNYWLDIIDQKGGPLDDDAIFNMFSESRSLSKNLESYGNRKSNILSTARRLSEFLGSDILEEKLKCEFIMSRWPLNTPVADRAIPVMIFKSSEKDIFLKKWLKTSNIPDLRDIIDWEYYRKRFESILQRLIVIPAFLQQIVNPIPRVVVPNWIKDNKLDKLNFIKNEDIEDIVVKRKIKELFYEKEKKKTAFIEAVRGEYIVPQILDVPPSLENSQFIDYINHNKAKWLEFYIKSISLESNIMKIEVISSDIFNKKYLNGKVEILENCLNLFVDVVESVYFTDCDKVSKYLCSQNCTKTLYNLKITERDFKSSQFTGFFNHFSIKHTYNLLDPMFELLASNEIETEAFDVLYISSFNLMNKPLFVITTNKTYYISDLKHPSILKTTLKSFRDSYLNRFRVVITCKMDQNKELITKCFDDCFFVPMDISPVISLNNLEGLMKIHNDLHIQMKLKFQQLYDIARYFKIPLLNIDDNLLDYMFYKELLKNECISTENTRFVPGILREEMTKPGYYGSYCISFECSNSVILSIIDYKTIAAQHLTYHGYLRKDFQVLRSFLRNLVFSALKNNSGTRLLLQNIAMWLKKSSKIICPELRETIEVTHQQFLVGLLSKLKEYHYTIVAASKDLIIINTGKNTKEGCDQFIQYFKKKIAEINGYELLNFKILRSFDKLGFIDFENYFAIENGEIAGFSDIKMPLNYLKDYFKDQEITNEEFFGFVREVTVPSMKLMLRLLSYKRDIHGLASNCYKLKKHNEFEDTPKYEFNLSIFCRNCNFENLLRKFCLKCHYPVEKEVIEAECSLYLKYCWRMRIFGDLICNKCGNIEEKKLKEYCYCGGKYIRKDYNDEIIRLKSFIDTRKFDLEVKKYFAFFN